jgi:WD40 repeat protein
MLNERFQKVEDEYYLLRGQLTAARLTPQQFSDALKKLTFEYEKHYWMIGANTGKWHIYDGKNWKQAEPPQAAPPTAISDSGQPVALHEIRQFEGHTEAIVDIAFSADSNYALTASDGTMRLWDVKTGREIRCFRAAPPTTVQSVAFSANGRYALSGSFDCAIRVWEIGTGREILRWDTKESVNYICCLPDGHRGLSFGMMTDWVCLWDLENAQAIGRFRQPDVLHAVLSPDGKRILSNGLEKIVRLWDISSCSEIKRFEGPQFRTNVFSFAPDGRSVLSADPNPSKLRLWNAETGEEFRSFPLASPSPFTRLVTWASCTPDGRYIVASTWDKAPDEKVPVPSSPDRYGVSVWDFNSGRHVARFVGHTESIVRLAISPDSRCVLTGSADKTARLWALP